ncbi:MAG: anhydro-N-acetylmuramic acid kinase, partial [Planctomycetota bacterium]|nr:anhydro-N-acetylmuramic acid kinase [Planctomycetota bacterium]
PQDIRDRVLNLPSANAREICEMNFILGRHFAEAACALLEADSPRIDLIGSHGQTVCHIDPREDATPSTLQIGEGSVIAEATGAIVICDFRTRDVAAGGSGAPLVPYADYLLFREEGRVRALQNIGGIANLTVVPDRADGVFAFDTGPGNMVIDHVARTFSGGNQQYDPGGELAGRGQADGRLLGELLDHPYLRLSPPKSTGREDFGAEFADEVIRRHESRRPEDILATATMLTAASIHQAYERFVFPRTRIDEVLVSGGGVFNHTLMRALGERFDPIPVRNLGEVSEIAPESKEAVAFAILANEAIHGHAAGLPAVTGASRPVVLGKLVV